MKVNLAAQVCIPGRKCDYVWSSASGVNTCNCAGFRQCYALLTCTRKRRASREMGEIVRHYA